MENFKRNMQSFGKSLLFPISLLSFMAIFLGVAAAFQNKEIIAVMPFLEAKWIQDALGFVRKLAGLPFGNLPLLFAMAIPYGMVKRDKEVAVFSSVVAYLAFLIGINYILSLQGLTPETTSITALIENGYSEVDATIRNAMFTNTLGMFVYNTNVIGGILVGLGMVWVHNKFRATELPAALSFYSGRRFVPIISALIFSVVGIVLTFIWPFINSAIVEAGQLISKSGMFGAFLYGFVEKIINPTGLHHILNQTFRFTALGGVQSIDGQNVVGALNIFLAELDLGLPFSASATQYLAQGKILHMVFGMPGAVFAIYKMAKPEKRKKLMRFFIPGLTAVILTGITEPIEFTFIFISPILWVMNAIFAGLAFLVPAMLEVTIGNIQGGVIDWFVFGVLQGMDTKWWIFLIAGPIFFILYYYSYMFVIKKFNVLTLGRSDSDFEDDDSSEGGIIQISETAKIIVEGLGGLDNIVDVDNCISRLRVEIKDGSKIDEDLIRKTNPNGIIRPDANTIHIVYGGRITSVRNQVDDYMYSCKLPEVK